MSTCVNTHLNPRLLRTDHTIEANMFGYLGCCGVTQQCGVGMCRLQRSERLVNLVTLIYILLHLDHLSESCYSWNFSGVKASASGGAGAAGGVCACPRLRMVKGRRQRHQTRPPRRNRGPRCPHPVACPVQCVRPKLADLTRLTKYLGMHRHRYQTNTSVSAFV